jgi:hypothetical protein
MKNSEVVSILAEAEIYDLLFDLIPNSVLLAVLKNLTDVLG